MLGRHRILSPFVLAATLLLPAGGNAQVVFNPDFCLAAYHSQASTTAMTLPEARTTLLRHGISEVIEVKGRWGTFLLLGKATGASPFSARVRGFQDLGVQVVYDPATNAKHDRLASFDRKNGILSLGDHSIRSLDPTRGRVDHLLDHESTHVNTWVKIWSGQHSPYNLVFRNTLDGGALSHRVSDRFRRFYGDQFPADELEAFDAEQANLEASGTLTSQQNTVRLAQTDSAIQAADLTERSLSAVGDYLRTGNESYQFKVRFTTTEWYKSRLQDGRLVPSPLLVVQIVRFEFDTYDIELPVTTREQTGRAVARDKQAFAKWLQDDLNALSARRRSHAGQ